MPNIDSYISFKKRNFRSWDTDLLSKLKINDSTDNTKKLESNLSQTEAKLESNLSQNKAKLESNLSQTEAKLESNLSLNLSQNLSLTRVKLESKKSPVNKNHSFLSLVGIQRNLTIYIYELCILKREKITMPLSIENMANKAKTTISSTRKALQRMEKKGIIIRAESKSGRSGWTRYELNENVYHEIIHNENLQEKNIHTRENLSQTRDKLESELRTELEPTALSSSSLNRSTTRTENEKIDSIKNEHFVLPEEWENIDYSFLEDIGFNKNKLLQIYQAQKLTADMVQSSLLWYDFDRKNNTVKHANPIGLLMSLLKIKGMPYDMPKNYESPQEIAMRRYVEQKEAERERKKQQEDMFKKTTFEEWFEELSSDSKEKILSNYTLPRNLNPQIIRGALINYFDEHVWIEKKKMIVGVIS